MISKLLMIPSDVAAAIDTMENATVATPAVERVTLWDMALNGGWIMLVLALLLVLAIYIFIERYLTLNGALKGEADSRFMDQIRQYVHEGNIDEARRLAKETATPLGRMISKGFSRLGRPLPDIQAAIENEGQLEVARLEKHVSLVATVASLGPMIGFLGTVVGMISAFQEMAHAGNNIDIQMLASGIYTAMVTTVGGLIVGIVCYFLHNLLVTRINKVVFELEVRANEFMDLLHEPA
ncbi:MAG: MotA/TolQ/ExbB proton channel family protein [Bacteroidales bacterium]|nr:MotA/TolQ/ExbB proton channel family protein [Bacteroidales bacterium]